MRLAFASLMVVHAAIHLLGFVKGFGLAPLPQLVLPVSRPMGLVWLAAMALLLAAVATLVIAPRWFWLVGVIALVVSQTAIVASWSDARFGTVANVVLLLGVVYGAFAWGPFGLRAEYQRLARDVSEQVAAGAFPPVISETDLAALPPPVQPAIAAPEPQRTPRASPAPQTSRQPPNNEPARTVQTARPRPVEPRAEARPPSNVPPRPQAPVRAQPQPPRGGLFDLFR
jgi:hypothetical protein